MERSITKSILSGTIWGILSKILDAFAKFVTIPILVGFYGKVDYGLIALAFSLNTYMRLMDMGMNIGSIRYFSIWVAQKNWSKITAVSKSSMVFYGLIGIVNAIVFVYLGNVSQNFFNLQPNQYAIFKWIMYILAGSTVINWISNVINQLLIAHGETGWVNRVTVISSIFNFLTAIISVKFNYSLPIYFFLYTLSTLIVVPLNVYRLKIYDIPLLRLLKPQWNGPAFKEIMGYSISIFAMGIFQLSADNLRPLLLSKFASKGLEVLTEYRVLQTITALVIAFGGVFMQVLLPSTAKMHADEDSKQIENLIYDGTKYISIFLCLVVFGIMSNSKMLLQLFMGEEYGSLHIWLNLWLITCLISMHNLPVASMVLSTGRTKPLLYISIISCVVSLPVTVVFADSLNVGAAVIGYLIYVVIQLSFYYIYYIPKVLNLNSYSILSKSFTPPLLIGIFTSGAINIFTKILVADEKSWLILFSFSAVFAVLYLSLTYALLIGSSGIKNIRVKLSK